MDISHQLKQVGFLLTQYRLVTILEQVADSVMAQVMLYGITGQQPAHHRCDRYHFCLKQQVKMIGEENPGKATRSGLEKNNPKTG